MRAKPKGQLMDEVNGIGFGTLFRLKSHRVHGGGIGALGVVLTVDSGDEYSRQLIVAFESCPVARYRLSVREIETIKDNEILRRSPKD